MTAESRQKVILNWFILHASFNKNNNVYVKCTKLNYIYKIKKKTITILYTKYLEV